MKRHALAIWGTSGHARVVASLVRQFPRWGIAGFLDDVNSDRHGSKFEGADVLGGKQALPLLFEQDVRHLFFAFGANRARLSLAHEVAQLGWFSFPSLVHPMAVLAEDVELGEGVFIGPGAIVNSGACIGNQVIINSGAIVEHESRVAHGAHVGPRACLTGGVEVGECAWIGAGAVIRDHLCIGVDATVGMGAVVTHSVRPGDVVVGCPARPLAARRA